MRHGVRFHPAARDEAFEIARFLAKSASPGIALSWLASLEEAIDALASMPRRHPMAREAGLFAGIEQQQVLVGRLSRDLQGRFAHAVDVLHIRHASRLGLDPSAVDPPDAI